MSERTLSMERGPMGLPAAPLLSGALLLLLALLLPAPALAQTTLERLRGEGVVRIAFANEAPFGYATVEGELTGEAPEIAKAIFRQMGIPEVDGVLTEWGALLPGLAAKRFDVVAAGMFITPPRCEQAAFSEPTYRLGQAFLVARGNPHDLHSYADVAGNPEVTLGIMAGAIERDYAREAGIPEDRLLLLPDQASMVSAVRAGRADAVALTALSIQRMAERAGDRVERAAPFQTPPGALGYGGFAFRKEDTALLAEFNRHLTEFIGTPEHLALVKEFGFTKTELPGGATTAQLCAGG